MADNSSLYDRASTLADAKAQRVDGYASTANGRSAYDDAKTSAYNSPVAQTVKSELATTQAEFQNLADSRRTRPTQTAATGQPLTHYHSMFYNLLSWQNPRATAVAYLTGVALIFTARYLPVVPYTLRLLYIVLGVTASSEVIGRSLFNSGFASQVRPRRYYTLPKEAVDRVLDDVHELLNFFVIESQRILFAENVGATITAFVAALSAYYLNRLVPLWGLSLIGLTALFLAPLIYRNNKELIDQQLHHLSRVVNQQAVQVKELAEHHTARATETVKAYAGDYSALAQEYIGHAKDRTAATINQLPDNLAAAKDQTVAGAKNTAATAQDYLGTAKDRTVSGAKDAAATTQEYVGAAKDRTVSGTQNAAATAQDYLGTAKDRTVSGAKDASATAQEYVGAAKDSTANTTHSALRATNPDGYTTTTTAGYGKAPAYYEEDFPLAPQQVPTPIADQYASVTVPAVPHAEIVVVPHPDVKPMAAL
ncbi:MAG: hypothetical protein M1826_007604 [Phylliscum demangeonii]|nr:MAG: hypothetical protein M1826_007604 [Phylliscum demangeonii]